MTKITSKHWPVRQYSNTTLWVSLISTSLLLAVLVESVCLGILYVNNSLRGRDNSNFAKEHLLTSLFVSAPHVAGLPLHKHFIGYLRSDWAAEWRQFLVPDDLLGCRLAAASSAFDVGHGYKYLYITDDNGFVVDADDPPVTLQKSVDTYRVIVLGRVDRNGHGRPAAVTEYCWDAANGRARAWVDGA